MYDYSISGTLRPYIKPGIVKKLCWKNGGELEAEIKGDKLIIGRD